MNDGEGNVVLVVGVGNVGAGIAMAFVQAGWVVFSVDPSASCVPSALTISPHRFHLSAVEDLPDVEFASAACAAHEVVYAAECGDRDEYARDSSLFTANVARFEAFARRLRRLCPMTSHLAYAGGSWTRRLAETPGDDAEAPRVQDDSPPKPASEANPYELAKSAACEAAGQLSVELQLPITFYDWASIVPNLRPNFTVGAMTAAALASGSITYSAGAFGRPLLHAEDAGRVLLLCTQQRLKQRTGAAATSSGACFDVVLLPGFFTPFEQFAQVVKSEVDRSGHVAAEVALLEQAGCTPAFLRSRCISARLAACGFEPDAAAVERGLRDTCMAAVLRLKQTSSHS